MAVLADSPSHKRERPARWPRASRPGPLLAVRGLEPAAGASMIAYLVALTAARQARGPVLITGIGYAEATIAALSGVRAPLSLAAAARRVAQGLPLPPGLSAQGPHRLRVLASDTPEDPEAMPADALSAVLDSARHFHALTVIVGDGTPSQAADSVADAATHIAWVTAASAGGVEDTVATLTTLPAHGCRELIVARHVPGSAQSLAAIRRLAALRHAPLILFPSVDTISADRAVKAAAVPLQAILGALTR